MKLNDCKKIGDESAPKMLAAILKIYSSSCYDAGLCDKNESSEEITDIGYDLNDSLEANKENSEYFSDVLKLITSLKKKETVVCKNCIYYVDVILSMMKKEKGMIEIVLNTICSTLSSSARKECQLLVDDGFKIIENIKPREVCKFITFCSKSGIIQYDQNEKNNDEGNN